MINFDFAESFWWFKVSVTSGYLFLRIKESEVMVKNAYHQCFKPSFCRNQLIDQEGYQKQIALFPGLDVEALNLDLEYLHLTHKLWQRILASSPEVWIRIFGMKLKVWEAIEIEKIGAIGLIGLLGLDLKVCYFCRFGHWLGVGIEIKAHLAQLEPSCVD
jgi:hypothetical protein